MSRVWKLWWGLERDGGVWLKLEEEKESDEECLYLFIVKLKL